MNTQNNKALSIAIGSVKRIRKDIELSNEEKLEIEEQLRNREPGDNNEASEIEHIKERQDEVDRVLSHLLCILPEYEEKLANLLKISNDDNETLMDQARELLATRIQ